MIIEASSLKVLSFSIGTKPNQTKRLLPFQPHEKGTEKHQQTEEIVMQNSFI
jgi:hypothetical protein